ncbi:hypothetical protein [Asticcacaulis endophyticus]|uniref:START domain-containing protein n=1 Tax=Asticcacaulis endophyticus TaxID=1395890 RepID=A0A918USR2_9CAUL|nr:hypothetical protein [Asticcacaulis endophyticus]GGZ30586.1 hypothetical protein GCM10011273_16220 [Asticcacaulis endophyticus]
MKLKRFLAAATLATAVCVCAPQAFAAKTETFVKIEKPAAGTPVLLIKPEADLSMLTASGVTEPKVEWSDNAEKYLAEALEAAIKARSYTTHSVPIESYQEPRAVQLVKLNTVVTSSIAMQEWPALRLPTKTAFDWTLGEGTQVLIPQVAEGTAAPQYVIFLRATGSYSSGGRAALAVGAALLGAGVPLGGQFVQATLVDLKTGKVVWYEFDKVPTGEDIRTPEGATATVTRLFKKLPI